MLRPYESPPPPLPVLRLEVLLRHTGREHGARLRVQVDRLRRPYGEIAEQHHLGERPRMVGDVRAGRRAAFTRGDPLGVDALGPGILLRHGMGRHLGLLRRIEQLRILAVDPRDQAAAIADPELPAGVERPGVWIGDLERAGRIETAVAPYDRHRGPATL